MPLSRVDQFAEAQVALLQSAMGKEVADLSEDERFALCLAAGCAVELRLVDDAFRWFTKNPCGIVKRDGRFQVTERV